MQKHLMDRGLVSDTFLCLRLGGVAKMPMMPTIATNVIVAWSVCLSVIPVYPAKTTGRNKVRGIVV